jgi:hypothetical protein
MEKNKHACVTKPSKTPMLKGFAVGDCMMTGLHSGSNERDSQT